MGLPSMGPEYREMKRMAYRRRPHPTAVLFFLAAMVAEVLTAATWTQLLVSVALVLWLVRAAEAGQSLRYFVGTAGVFLAFYILIGCWFAVPGDHIFIRGPHIRGLGALAVSAESIVRTVFRAVRLWGVLLLVALLGTLTTAEDAAAWFGRRYSRIGLTISMVVRFIPGLLEERRRIADIVRLRGAVTSDAPLRQRVQAQAVVYHTLLTNALERSWGVAESMYVRGYGAGARSMYKSSRWHRADILCAVWALACVALNLLLPWFRTDLHARFGSIVAWSSLGCVTALAVWMGGRLRG